MSEDSFVSATSFSSSSVDLLQRPVPDSPFSDVSKSEGDDEDDVMADMMATSRDEADVEEGQVCCCSCHKPIKERHLLKVRGFHRPWHIRCLRCSVCHIALDSEASCFYRGRNIYCKTDYIGHRSRSFKCSKCQRVLGPTDWVRKARDHMYHLACFACDACKRQLSTGEEFALHDDRLLCKTHFVETATGTSENDGEDGSGQKQKTKRVRTSFTEEQLRILHANFRVDSNPDGQDLERIAQQTGLSKRVTQVWFQNSRARQKKHQHHTTSSTTPSSGVANFHLRLGVMSCSGASSMCTGVNVISSLGTERSPSCGIAVQSNAVVPHHSADDKTAASAASYMDLRGVLHPAHQHQGQVTSSQRHSSVATPNSTHADISSSPEVETIQNHSTIGDTVVHDVCESEESHGDGLPVQSAAGTGGVIPDMALIHAALHGYRAVQYRPVLHQNPCNMYQLQTGLIANRIISPSAVANRLLCTSSDIHFRRATFAESPVTADKDDGGCYFYDQDVANQNVGDSTTILSVGENNNETSTRFLTRRRHLNRSHESCNDHALADYYITADGDLSE